MKDEQKQSGIPCRLTGKDGNIFNLPGVARETLHHGGRSDLIAPLTCDVTHSQSYAEALAHIMEYIKVE